VKLRESPSKSSLGLLSGIISKDWARH
jgi:hypothetical protein